MTYIIATTDKNSGDELIKILEDDTTMAFRGSFATFKAAEASIREKPPDMAFIWLGNTEINAFRLASEIKERSPLSKVIFVSSKRESAVEAYEHEADGFLLTPFDKDKIEQMLRQNMEREIL
jgi:DNA-binding LytR/AlgR family response regulator